MESGDSVILEVQARTMSRRLLHLDLILLLLVAGCGSRTKKAPALGEAYVAPATLSLRKELAINSPAVTTVKHGERVEVIQTRRKFIRVRAASGIEGWTDNRQLITAAQMRAIKDLAVLVGRLPSYGRAYAVSILNGHTEPNRQSPSILQLVEKAPVDVVARRVTPRNAAPSIGPLVITPPARPARKKKAKRDVAGSGVPPPPAPRPPAPPEDWLELSKSDEIEEPREETPPPKPAKPVPVDQWALIRTPDGKAGWVLNRMLSMAIPDEVAQYSEGARIMSYHSLGQAHDGDVVKDHWIWTTQSKGSQDYDFDAYRVFIWSVRRHRYETAFVERSVEGFLPVTVHDVDVQSGKKTAKARGFSVLLRDDDGKVYRKTFWFEPWKVRLIDEQQSTLPPDPLTAAPAPDNKPVTPATVAVEKVESWWTRLRNKLKGEKPAAH